MHLDFLSDLLAVFVIGGLVVYAVRPLALPPIIGLLVAGALVGPHGLSLVADTHRVEVLAEIGVVLLLFTIGVEFSLGQLVGMWKTVVGVGGGQVVLTIGAFTGAALLLTGSGGGLGGPVFLGFLAALSSTAIVLRLLGDRGEVGTPHGRIALGVLLFQDLCVVPLMLLTPFLAGRGSGWIELGKTLLLAGGVVVGVLVAAKLIVPFVLAKVVGTRSRELFLTLLVVLCLGTAWLTSLAGLSLALGAFLAGMAISESEYSHQALAEAIPFRDAFTSLFFVSVGMLLDAGFVVSHLPVVFGATAAVLVLKALCASLPAIAMGHPLHVAVWAGCSLAQVGEFAFVLSHAGLDLGLMTHEHYQIFLSASVITMLVTPGLLRVGDFFRQRLEARPVVPWEAASADGDDAHAPVLEGHVIIVGYGVNGHNLARALAAASIPYVILELNPETVRAARERGEPILFGDCTRAAVLEHLGLAKARVLVVAISDAAATRQTTSVARAANSSLHIVVRTRFVAEVETLRKIGADQVIPEEFETSIEIFSRVLDKYSVPRNVVLDLVGQVRGGTYEMLRDPTTRERARSGPLLELPGLEVESVQVREGSPAINHTLAEFQLRKRSGATVVAVHRNAEVTVSPGADFRFEQNDVAVLIGDRPALDRALVLVEGERVSDLGAEDPPPRG